MLFRHNRQYAILGLVILMTALSGCSSWWDAYKNWSYRMGEKMPVFGEERCENNYFCWGGNDSKTEQPAQSGTTASRRAPMENRGQSGAVSAPAPAYNEQRGMPPPPMPVYNGQGMGMPPQPVTSYPMPGRPQPYGNQGMMPVPPPPPPGMGMYPGDNGTPMGNMPPPPPPAGMMPPPGQMPPGMDMEPVGPNAPTFETNPLQFDNEGRPLLPQDKQAPLVPEKTAGNSGELQPHEENPPWFNDPDLPKSPIDELKQQLEW